MKKANAVVAAVTLMSLALGSAVLAASAQGSWSNLFGPVTIGGVRQCASQQAVVNNTSNSAYGYVRARRGDPCDNSYNRPAGHLGTIQFVIRQSTGAVCGFTDWTYNSSSAYMIGVPAFWTGPNSSCPSGAAYYSLSKGRYWRTDNGTYVTSDHYGYSPSLNF